MVEIFLACIRGVRAEIEGMEPEVLVAMRTVREERDGKHLSFAEKGWIYSGMEEQNQDGSIEYSGLCVRYVEIYGCLEVKGNIYIRC